MELSRRTVMKGAGYAGAAAIGAKGLHEAGSEVVDMLNGECDTMTDTITLGPGDAVHYRHDDQTYYLEHIDDDAIVEADARFGPVNGPKETVHVDYHEQVEIGGGYATVVDRTIPFYIHVNLGDIVTGGDVVEPRGFLGIKLDNLKASYDKPVCVIERGEADEMGVS